MDWKKRSLWPLALALLAGAGLHAAASSPAAGDDVNQLRRLAPALAQPPALPEQGATRSDVAQILAPLAQQAAQGGIKGWEARDYDALYALLEKYRADLDAMEQQRKEINSRLDAMRDKSDRMEKDLLSLLLPKDGLKIHGHVLVDFDDVLTLGPGLNNGVTTRYRHALGRTELDFSTERGPVSALARFDIENLLGDAFGQSAIRTGFRRLSLEIRTPVVFQVGNFDEQMTPLTVWRNEDPFPYESQLDAERRQRLRQDLQLKDNAWLLNGLQLSTELDAGSTELLALKGFISPLAYAGSYVYTRDDGTAFNAIYNTYLGGWRAGLPPLGGLSLAYQGTALVNATDSMHVTYTAAVSDPALVGKPILGMEAEVHSLSLQGRWMGDAVHLSLEAARSLYSNPNDPQIYADATTGRTGFLTGTAATATLGFDGSLFGLELGGRYADAGFRSVAAQGRSEDPGSMPAGPFLMENTLFNPQSGQYGGIGVPEAPLPHFNATLLFPGLMSSSGEIPPGYLMPYDRDVNPVSPYGDATPNRSGGSLKIHAQSPGQALRASAGVEMASQIAPEGGRPLDQLMTYGGGFWLDLDKLCRWPVALNAGYFSADERNSDWLAYSSAMLDLGMTLTLAGKAKLLLSARQLDANGTLPYTGSDPLILQVGHVSSKHAYQNAGVGLDFPINDSAVLVLSYDSFWYFDPFDVETRGIDNGYQISQGFARVSMEF